MMEAHLEEVDRKTREVLGRHLRGVMTDRWQQGEEGLSAGKGRERGLI